MIVTVEKIIENKIKLREVSILPKDLKIFNDSYFREWIKTLKQIIKQSQLKAAIHVNSELLQLYWDIGKEIVQRDIEAKWGSKIFATMSSELKDAFPGMEGFSVTNLKYMKRFFQFYSNDDEIGQQPVDQFEKLYSIPWGHQILLITKCKTVREAFFYVNKILENGWSRAVLLNFLETGLFERQGKAITNFSRLLPDTQSDLAKETLQKKKETDNETLGLLICKTKDDIMAEYSLEASSQPIGISEYKLKDLLPNDYVSSLPTIAEIEESLKNLQ